MNVNIAVQVADDLENHFTTDIPNQEVVENWVKKALKSCSEALQEPLELSIKVVGEAEITQLNERFRKKTGPTNVLSFPFESPGDIKIPLLGDVVICAPIVVAEAREQAKSPEAHWAHLLIHGTLHLLGYDHKNEDDAVKMETKEIEILNELGYSDPYKEVQAR